MFLDMDKLSANVNSSSLFNLTLLTSSSEKILPSE
jgi:hypothetical protein